MVGTVPGKFRAWTASENATLALLWAEPALTAEKISENLPGRSAWAVRSQALRLGLSVRPRVARIPRKLLEEHDVLPRSPAGRVRKAYAALGDDVTLSRFVKIPPENRGEKSKKGRPQLWLPDLRHKALETGVSIFHKNGVKPVTAFRNLLVSGHSNAKIGRDVRKGLFRGYWIYTLSFEERATCPRSCKHWQSCYGNNMPYAKRIDHRDLETLKAKLEKEILRLLYTRGRKGILIRLHALGDFFDPAYVRFWGLMLALDPKLACYGYTARRPDDPIGQEIAKLKRLYGRRFAIRWSDGGEAEDCTISIRSEDEAPAKGVAFVCPEQTFKTAACATCGLCWSTTRNVCFMEH